MLKNNHKTNTFFDSSSLVALSFLITTVLVSLPVGVRAMNPDESGEASQSRSRSTSASQEGDAATASTAGPLAVSSSSDPSSSSSLSSKTPEQRLTHLEEILLGEKAGDTDGVCTLAAKASAAAGGEEAKTLPPPPQLQSLGLVERIERLERLTKPLGSYAMEWDNVEGACTAFRDRLRARLTSLFGANVVLKSGKIAKSKPAASLGLDITEAVTSFIPAGGGAAFSLIRILGEELVAQRQERREGGVSPFTSFADIDKATFITSGSVAYIYSSQIRRLSRKDAEVLADSAYNTIKWYVEKYPQHGVTPPRLALTVGLYHCVGSKYGYPKLDTIQPLDDPGETWNARGVFLGSGIRLVDDNDPPLYINAQQGYWRFNRGFLGSVVGNDYIFTKARDEFSRYGFRQGTESYFAELSKLRNFIKLTSIDTSAPSDSIQPLPHPPTDDGTDPQQEE